MDPSREFNQQCILAMCVFCILVRYAHEKQDNTAKKMNLPERKPRSTPMIRSFPFDSPYNTLQYELEAIQSPSPIGREASVSSMVTLTFDENDLAQLPEDFLESSPFPPTAPSELGNFTSVFPANESGTNMSKHEATSSSLDRFISGLPESGPKSPQDTKLRKTISDVVSKQADVFAKRSQARELRLALRYKRDEEASIRAEPLKKINAFHAQSAVENIQSLSSEVEKIQSATDSYLSLENKYQQTSSSGRPAGAR